MTPSNFRFKISHAFLRNYRSCVLKFNYNSQRAARHGVICILLCLPSFSRPHLALTVSGISGYSRFVNTYVVENCRFCKTSFSDRIFTQVGIVWKNSNANKLFLSLFIPATFSLGAKIFTIKNLACIKKFMYICNHKM